MATNYKDIIDNVREKFNKELSQQWFRQQLDLNLKPFEDLLADKYLTGESVLDIGCASARTTRILAEKHEKVVGIDIAYNLLREGKKEYPCLQLVCGNITHLPFKNQCFDSAFMMGNVIQYIPGKENRKEVFSEIHRLLKPKGTLVMTTTNFCPTLGFDIYRLFQARRSLKFSMGQKIQVTRTDKNRGVNDSQRKSILHKLVNHIYRYIRFRYFPSIRWLWRKVKKAVLSRYYHGPDPGDFAWKTNPYLEKPDSFFFFYNSTAEVLDEANTIGFKLVEYKCKTEVEEELFVPQWLRFKDAIKIYIFRK